MEIGLFQLENLVHSRAQFLFLDVRETRPQVPPNLEQLLSSAIKVEVKEVANYLQKNLPNPQAPVILLSEDGKSAANLSSTLESAGYGNVYVIEGGVEGLLSEL